MNKKTNPVKGELIPKEKQVKMIGDIQGLKTYNPDSSGWKGLVKSLHPLQHVSESIAQICHYRHQIKVLETEQIRIREEANIRHHQIDAALEAGLKTLEERRLALKSSLEVVSKELEHTHIERNKIVECITNLTVQMSDKEFSTEDRQVFHTSITTLSVTLKDMGAESTTKLSLIANNTQKALEALPQTRALLTFSD